MQKQASLLLIDCNESGIECNHRYLSKIDCLMARTAGLVCFISTVNGRSKKKKKKSPWKTGARSGHITNLKQSILTFDIYECNTPE
jgi:hypothetical protein